MKGRRRRRVERRMKIRRKGRTERNTDARLDQVTQLLVTLRKASPDLVFCAIRRIEERHIRTRSKE